MASLVRNGRACYAIKFRWEGVQYLRSLGTTDLAAADAALKRLEAAVAAARQGWTPIPDGADPAAFLMGGGRAAPPPVPDAPLTLASLFDRWGAALRRRDGLSSMAGIHRGHLERGLGRDRAVATLTLEALQAYCDGRLRGLGHKRAVRACTVDKELATLRQVWRWGARRGLVPPLHWAIADLGLPADEGREPFRTHAEITRILARGGLDAAAEARLWACLYLTGDEVLEALAHVVASRGPRWFTAMFAFAALAGARRAEILRSEVEDWDLDTRTVHVRERKRDSSREFTLRAVAVHPRLGAIMRDWLGNHPGGRLTICRDDGTPPYPQATAVEFDRVLGTHPRWRHMRGFHVLRHSFASNLAARGVDPRVIDAIMGHQTEDMRRRYQHLVPDARQRAVAALFEGEVDSAPGSAVPTDRP